MAKQTKITIETDTLFILRGRTSIRGWDRVQQIARPVKVRLGGVALGTDQNHWLLRINGEVKPISRLF